MLNFVVIAFAIFWLVRVFERLKRKEELDAEEPAEPTVEEKLNDTLMQLTELINRKL